jgi:Fe-S-cluster containining protein
VFFLEEERQLVEKKYGREVAAKISTYQGRRGSTNIYAIDLPCPFFEAESGRCGIYEAQPFVCRMFPLEIEPITGTTYVEERACPKRNEAKINWDLVQINVRDWCDKFWQTSSENERAKSGPVGDQRP